jgi:calcium-dependent protein kinase
MSISRIVHRDLKPENILIDANGKIRIIDFGLSKYYIQGMTLKEIVGTPSYMAPEVTTGEYGPECDLWSVGIIMFRMLYGKLPDFGSGKEEILKRLRTGKFKILENEENSFFSNECKDLLEKLLEKNPSKRIKVKEALESRWFSRKNKENAPEWVYERVKMGNRPGKLQLAILQTASLALDHQDIQEVKNIFNSLDIMHQGVVNVKVGGISEDVKFSEFFVAVLKNRILEKGIPLLYEWCFRDGKFSSEKLRKAVSRRGSYFSSALFSKEFGSLEEFQRFLS